MSGGPPRLEAPYSRTRYSRVAPCDLALAHLDEPADAVLLVDDVVALLQLERVDLPLAPGRHPALVAGGAALAGQVVAGEQDEPEAVVDEAVGEGRAGDRDERRARAATSASGSTSRAGDVVLAEHLDHALRRAVPGVGDDDAVAVGEPAAQVGDRALEVAAVALDRRRGRRCVRPSPPTAARRRGRTG